MVKDDVVLVKDAVEAVLKEDERSRDDDKWLILQVLRRMNYEVYIPYKKMDDMPSFESITRSRRKFQADGLYPPSAKVAEKREEERQQMRRIEEWF